MEALYQWPFIIEKTHRNGVWEVFPVISTSVQSFSYSMFHFCIKDVIRQSEAKPANWSRNQKFKMQKCIH